MLLDDYITKFKSIDTTNKTPLEAYKRALEIASEYYNETGDSSLENVYFECSREVVQSDVAELLRKNGWVAVWKYLHTIPKESINDPYFMFEDGSLRAITRDDVTYLQTIMIKTLRDLKSESSEKEKLKQALRYLSDVVSTLENLIGKDEVN